MKFQKIALLLVCAGMVHNGFATLEGDLTGLKSVLEQLQSALSGVATPPPPPPPPGMGTPPPPPPGTPTTSPAQPGRGNLLADIRKGKKLKTTALTSQQQQKPPSPTPGTTPQQPKPPSPTPGVDPIEELKKKLALRQKQKKVTSQPGQPQQQPGTTPTLGFTKLKTVTSKAPVNLQQAPELPKTGPVKFMSLKNRIESDLPSYTIDLNTGKIGPTITPDHRLKAEKILQEIRVYINKNLNVIKSNPELVGKVVTLLEHIVYVDPLLINSVNAVMSQIGIPDSELYNFITRLYEHRVKYVEHEFGIIVDRVKNEGTGFVVTKGTAEDLDEGLAYAFELEGLTQEARLKGTSDSKQFSEKVENLRDRLLNLLTSVPKKHWKTLKDQGLPVEEYISMLRKPKQAFCVTEPFKKAKDLVYVPFPVDLAEILRLIEGYKKEIRKSKKAYTLQAILKKINGFYAYASDPKVCKICYRQEQSLLKYMQDGLAANKTKTEIVKEIHDRGIGYLEDRQKPVYDKTTGFVKMENEQQVVEEIDESDVVDFEKALDKISNFLQDLNKTEQKINITTLINNVNDLKNLLRSGSCPNI